jgi:hypothetical protein
MERIDVNYTLRLQDEGPKMEFYLMTFGLTKFNP